MFSITLSVGNAVWGLLYKNKEQAELDFGVLTSQNPAYPLVLVDDFGQKVALPCAPAGMLLEDLNESQKGAIERGLHHERMKATFTKLVASDPVLRMASGNMGPSILAPNFPRN